MDENISNAQKLRQIKQMQGLYEPGDLPGFSRFFSTDRQFPISLQCHARMGAFYDSNNPSSLLLNFVHFTVLRENYVALGYPSARASIEYGARGRVLLGQVRTFCVVPKSKRFVIGEDARPAPCVEFDGADDARVWVVFGDPNESDVLWLINQGAMDAADFGAVLRSFRWLSDDFYRSYLPALCASLAEDVR